MEAYRSVQVLCGAHASESRDDEITDEWIQCKWEQDD